MPKILINEIDKTTPGTNGGYSNYSVLIAGFRGETDLRAGSVIPADSNGVYEFSSAGDFEATIGLLNMAEKTEQAVTVHHYGNQMAYQLLRLGYTVVYKPIESVLPIEDSVVTSAETAKASFFDLFSESFWRPFRDRASYDFRFISHGLLESSVDLAENEAYIEAARGLAEVNAELSVIDRAIEELDRIAAGFESAQETNTDLEEAKFCNDWYSYGETFALSQLEEDKIQSYYEEFAGFKESEDSYYLTFYAAQGGTAKARENKEEERAQYDKTMQLIRDSVVSRDKINDANACIANLAKYYADTSLGISDDVGRGDCIALIELDENLYKNAIANPENKIIDAIKELGSSINSANGKYCAMTVPSVVYTTGAKMPGAFHYLACFINSLQSGFAEWYAAAGYTRGVASMTIDHTTVALGEIAINALEPRNRSTTGLPFACNVIANFRGSYYLWGNRTAHLLDDAGSNNNDLVASHFLNIRQLCITIKKQLYVACRRFTFDPNSDTLWFNFVNAIRPTLDNMKADQGIRDYKILKVPTAQKATLKAKIRIIPIEAVEDFDLTVSLEDSFGETTAVVTE